MERRDVIGSGLATGFAALFQADRAAAQRTGSASGDERATAEAIDALRQMLEQQDHSADVAQLRIQQRTFLRANQKFPDFIDVGIDVWERMHDWHIRTRQPLTITRTTDGRYGMAFAVTTLILQPQQAGGYISWGYDAH